MGSRKRNRRVRLDAPEPLEELLDRVGEHRFARKQLPIPLARWRAAVGPRIADRARPVAIERGLLIVKVVTSVWANELAMLAPQILEKLAKPSNLGPALDIKGLRFRVGPLEVTEGIQQRRNYRQVPAPAVLAPELEQSLERIEDDDLRKLIERAARSNLAWQTAPKKTAVSAAPRGARAPRGAGEGTSPQDRSAEGSDAASRGTPGADSYRRR